MLNRNRKTTDHMTQYYWVIGFFCVVCIGAIFVTIFNPKTKFSEMQILDESQILIHNG
jgi:hypothetical protein